MTAAKCIGLAGFGSVCFLFGFLTGEWAAYDGRTVRQMLTYNHDTYEKITKTQMATEVFSSYAQLGQALEYPEQPKYSFSAKEEEVKEIAQSLRRDLQNEQNYAVRVVMESALSGAEMVLERYSRNKGLNPTPQGDAN